MAVHPLDKSSLLTYIFNVIKRWFILLLLLVASLLFSYFRLYEYLNLDSLRTYQHITLLWTMNHYILAVGLYILIFVGLIACAIPCATFLTLVGGFLFGIIAILYATFSITFGGMILFLAIRTAIGAHIAAKSAGWIKKMETGFQKNAFNYLLMLRLVPLFPCWISNIAAGALNVPVRTFIIATTLGVLPATFIYVMAGRSLDKLLIMDKSSFINLVLTPGIFFPLLGLAFLSIFPVIYNGIKRS